MNVFVLTTGRAGSVSFANACKHITNYSSGHESRASEVTERLHYPDNHIEADNRLCWFLGDIDKKYGNSACYIVLKRDLKTTAQSLAKRIKSPTSIVRAFVSATLKSPYYDLSNEQLTSAGELYCESLYANVDLFLKDKDTQMTIYLEDIEAGFRAFWKLIGAEGDLEKAIETLKTPKNTSKEYSLNALFKLKSFLKSQSFHLFRKL